ncbi:MAG: PqqD family protein [Clostridia bacterium]|nr:PqqD family protein [Clostridia bacterium]
MRLKDQYASTTLLGRVVAVPLGAGLEFKGTLSLNKTGAAVFEMLKKGTTEEEIVETLSRRYDMPRETIQRDVRVYLEAFMSRGLLEQGD